MTQKRPAAPGKAQSTTLMTYNTLDKRNATLCAEIYASDAYSVA